MRGGKLYLMEVKAPANPPPRRPRPPQKAARERSEADGPPRPAPRPMPLDVRIVLWATWPWRLVVFIVQNPDRAYIFARPWPRRIWSFLWAHWIGPVTSHEYAYRDRICRMCEQRVERPEGVYCEPHRRGCGCPTRRWWWPAQLPHVLRLKATRCPQGRFPDLRGFRDARPWRWWPILWRWLRK
jgi:hypothetical protein